MLWTIFASLVITFVSIIILTSMLFGSTRNPLFGSDGGKLQFDAKWKPRLGDKYTDYLAVLVGLIIPLIVSITFWVVFMWGNIWGDWF
jgi:hypothetical protein